MAKLVIMKKVDEIIYQNIDKLRSQDQVQNFIETYNSWEDQSQNIFKSILLGGIIIIPLTLLLIFFLLNSSAHSSLDTKRDILKYVAKISDQKNDINSISRKYLGRAMGTEQLFKNQVTGNLSSMNIERSKIKISNFNSDEESGINQISADISFRDLSSQNLFAFLNTLTIRKKMRIEEIDIKKNKVSNLLEGLITINHFSKLQSMD